MDPGHVPAAPGYVLHSATARSRSLGSVPTADGEVGDGGVCQGEVQLTSVQSADVLLRAARGFGRRVPAEPSPEFVEHLGERAADDEERSPGWGRSHAQKYP